MKISDIKKPRLYQTRLFETPIGNHGKVRTLVGNFVEECTARLLGGDRHKVDSRCDYCPDVSVKLPGRERFYIECKAAGKSRQTFIYQGRLEKDKEFAKEHDLYYIVFHHGVETKWADTEEHLFRLLFDKMRTIYMIPFEAIPPLCTKLDKLNSGYGGTDRKAYGSGYRINISALEKWKVFEWRSESGNLYLTRAYLNSCGAASTA